MHTQIRLAERQGLLRGRINNVQQRALALLDDVEQVEKAKAVKRELRGYLSEIGWDRFAELFSDYVAPEDREEVKVSEAELDSVMADTEATVRYESAKDEMTPEKFQQMLAGLMANAASGTVNGADVGGGWQ